MAALGLAEGLIFFFFIEPPCKMINSPCIEDSFLNVIYIIQQGSASKFCHLISILFLREFFKKNSNYIKQKKLAKCFQRWAPGLHNSVNEMEHFYCT